MNTQASKNKGGISDEKLKELKAKYPDLKCGSIEDLKNPSQRLYFYYVKPSKDIWKRALSHIMDKDFAASKTHFHTHCVKFQQPEIESNGFFDENILAIGTFIGDKFKMPEAVDEDF